MFIKPPHDQQIFFDNGTTRWVRDVKHIEQGNWFHLYTKSGVDYITNPDHILFVRVFPPGKARKYGEQ
jgi:hypothetical protein